MIVDVVGLGLNPRQLSQIIQERIQNADVLVGGRRQLSAFENSDAEKLQITSPLEQVIETIRERLQDGKKVMVLADGDPLFYGIGKRLTDELGAKNVRIHPGVTTLQTAAARLGIPWHDIKIVSMHGRGDYTPIFSALTWRERVAVFTDDYNTPARIAQALLDRGANCFGMWVFEDLESDLEHVGKYNLEHAAVEKFSPLNFIVLERIGKPGVQLRLGIPDEDFVHENGLITKGPVRAAGLASLALKRDSVMWDLGAGCGSVAIEAAVLVQDGAVYAVEKNLQRFKMIQSNIKRTGAFLVNPVHATLPDGLDELPDPDRIFIGGGLGGSSESVDEDVLALACERLKPGGRITAHVVLLDSLNRTKAYLESLGWPVSITQVQCSLSKPLAGDLRMQGMNPVFIVAARKPDVEPVQTDNFVGLA